MLNFLLTVKRGELNDLPTLCDYISYQYCTTERYVKMANRGLIAKAILVFLAISVQSGG